MIDDIADLPNIIDEIADLPVSKLKDMLKERGQSGHGTKSELVMKLALRQLTVDEISAGKFQLSDMTVPELRDLKTSLGVKGTAKNKSALVELLESCLVK